MYPAVVTAVLLLASIQVTETAGCQSSPMCDICHRYPDEPCGDRWSRFDENLCAKHINSPKTFHEAQKHCRTLNADLVSLHDCDEMDKVICLTWRADSCRRGIWIGAQRSGNETRYIDGSEFKVPVWHRRDSSNYGGKKACIKLNVKGKGCFPDWGSFNDIRCWKKKNFVCVKNVSTSTADPE